MLAGSVWCIVTFKSSYFPFFTDSTRLENEVGRFIAGHEYQLSRVTSSSASSFERFLAYRRNSYVESN